MRLSVRCDDDYTSWSFQVLSIEIVGIHFLNESKFPGPGRHKDWNNEEETCHKAQVNGQQQKW